MPYPFARPVVPPPERWTHLLEAPWEQRWFSNGGPLVRRLERELADRVGDGRDVVLVCSATAGLVAALLALEVQGPVAVPAFTFPATVHAIEMAGCTPVFVDIDPATWELDPAAARAAIDVDGCVAILHVRAFGLCRDLRAIEAVAQACGVPLVVDAAAAFGGRTPTGVPAGHAGDMEVVSFHATKVFAMGEGGAVICSPEDGVRVRQRCNFALEGGDVVGRGLNAKMSEIAAAVGFPMLEDFDAHLAARARAAARLLEVAVAAGAGVPGPDAGAPPWQCLPFTLPGGVDQDAALAVVAAHGIEGRAYYCPGLHRSPAWSGPEGPLRELPATDALASRSMCMPIYADFTDAELEFFADALAAALVPRGDLKDPQEGASRAINR